MMTKIRGFELVSTYTNQDLLPKRETAHAAGYDLKVAERTVIAPGEIVLVPTGVKAYMQNITDQEVVLEVGERVVQAVFAPFLIADGDEADGVRTGGFGSTGH